MKKTLLFLIWSSATFILQGHPQQHEITKKQARDTSNCINPWISSCVLANSISISLQKSLSQSKFITNKPASPTSISLVDSFNEMKPLGIRRPQSLAGNSNASLQECETPDVGPKTPSPAKPENERARAYSTESYAGDYVLASLSMSPEVPQQRKRIGYQTHPTPPLGNPPSVYRAE